MANFDDQDNPTNLADEILKAFGNGVSATAKLQTSKKVLARVTDGIYRLPGSALRELISNSYDADATNVWINTDVPRFESMTIRDDGNGMSVETLAHLLQHIGGSAKRTEKGKGLNVTDESDPTRSPVKKRKLIGKIGIGLFSVAQLTREFEIVTKQKGDHRYLHAKIELHNYSEEYIEKEQLQADIENRGARFETGTVSIWEEPTDNIDAHGTDIILHKIRKSAQQLLQSVDIWGQAEDLISDGKSIDSQGPVFHIGSISGDFGAEVYTNTECIPNLPWSENDSKEEKFSKLYDAILALTKNTVSPKLGQVLDNYLNMIWTLGLSIPLDYIDGHPFCLSNNDLSQIYVLSNQKKGQAQLLPMTDGQCVAEAAKLPTSVLPVGFNVYIDEVKLFRPIKYRDLPSGGAIIKKPILFIGHYAPDLSELDIRESGGGLQFDAYIFWQPRVIPRDHNGVLIRLHNASGIMFDETFMKHQVAEYAIKAQLTAEIFVNRGLESALNIDRESFNISHPHYQIIMRWLHQALRQVVNKYKALKKDLSIKNRQSNRTQLQIKLAEKIDGRLDSLGMDPLEKPVFKIQKDDVSAGSPDDHDDEQRDATNTFVVNTSDFATATGMQAYDTEKSFRVEAKAEALLQLMNAYGLLNNLSPSRQRDLMMDILSVLSQEG